MNTQDIYNYREVNDLLSLSGQPTEEQLKSAAHNGFKVVINLATINPRYSLPDEGTIVRSLGMIYYHIPVEWGNPTEDDFIAFENVLKQFSKKKMLIHCAANFRATAFYTLYALKNLGWSNQQGEAFMAPIWQDSNYPAWDSFMEQMKTMIGRGSV